jgi:beta-N-acetylhexosaminidase
MILSEFSNEQLAGQRLLVGFEGTYLNADLKYFIGILKVGGIVLFSRNLTSPDQIKNLCMSAQRYARSSDQPPLIIAIDQEGGTVARLKPPFSQFPGNSNMENQKEAEQFSRITAKELTEIGINMNLAPVMDVLPVNSQKEGSAGRYVMAERAFGHDPLWVSEMGTTVISHLQKMGIMAVAKHFPGIGRTTLDSHQDMPVLDTDKEALSASDLVPFVGAVESGVSGMMLSHIRYQRLDSQWPASLSGSIARDLLRNKMGFTGIIMTDDLDMGAIARHYDMPSVISQILSADVDMAMICRQKSNIETAYAILVKKIREDDSTRERARAAVKRIMRQKERFCYG